MEKVPQLSCELCRERKVKCDKLTPCTTCASAGVVCVPVRRPRLPRGRHARRSGAVDDNLKTRIRRLEALVSDRTLPTAISQTQSQAQFQPQSRGPDLDLAVRDQNHNVNAGPEIRAPLVLQEPSHFWADLADEIHGLRNAIESTSLDDEDEDCGQQAETDKCRLLHRGISILGLSAAAARDPGTPMPQGRALASQLCHIYLQQVDPCIKILHRPSIHKFLVRGQNYLAYPEGHASPRVLSAAVSYAAASSMTENQCQATFRTPKASLVADCRRACEIALDASGLLTTSDMTVLQAFLLYLIARRSEERSRAVWTLLATAVRIAKGMSLNLDPDERGAAGPGRRRRETFFAQQMRKRLWLTICLVDLQASFGQTSQPLIALDEVVASCASMPAHINDADFGPATHPAIPDREGLTDTTLAMVTYKLQLMGRLTNFAAAPAGPARETPQQQKAHIDRFEHDVLRLLRLCDPEASAYAWFTLHSAQCFVPGARACLLRPLQRGPPPPPPSQNSTELLRLSVLVLQKALLVHTDPRGEGFRWYVTVQWHMVAIAAAECFVCADNIVLGADGDGDADGVADAVRAAWPVVEAASAMLAESGVGGGGGRLRGPLARLVERTRKKVQPVLARRAAGGGDPVVGLHHDLFDLQGRHALSPAPAPMSASTAAAAAPLVLETQPWLSEPTYQAANGIDVSANGELDGQSWGIWEEFVSGIAFEDPAASDLFFDEFETS
ncbi:C6 transcription factor [Lasiosphaeria ovina]|uniref:C6 transcription factor n=1 Tax=Lasiosphaeria ovina TaxID=92902 RepID=A0AAE0N118_9PEZI|nr:C6 transcription factor [Lasiosphaeria ovina]